MTFFIAGFPGVGKSYIVKNTNVTCYDSDSSLYSKNEDGTRNVNFINDYFNRLESLIEKDIPLVMVSTHELVLAELNRRNYNFTIVIPDIELKDEYIARYLNRHSNPSLIKIISQNWDEWINDIKIKYKNVHELKTGEYLIDYIMETYEIF